MLLPGLRGLRMRRALSLRDLAERSGVSHPTISNLERGKHTARPSTVRKLAAALGVDPATLMEPSDGQQPTTERGTRR